MDQDQEHGVLAVAGREKLFEREREADPDLYLWDSCVAACEAGE